MLRAAAGVLAGLGTGLAPLVWLPRPALAASAAPRVVVAGGGFGGVATASRLRVLDPRIEVVLVEPNERFFSAPATMDRLFDRVPGEAGHTREYRGLEGRGVRRVATRILAVDPHRRRVETDRGTLDYDALVLATGIAPDPATIEGLAAAGNLCPYERAALPALRAAIDGFEGGTVVVSVPPGVLKCPPAPYEFTLRLAESLAHRGVGAEIVLVDAWPSPQPDALGPALGDALLAAGVDYLGQDSVESVDPEAGEVTTGFGDRIPYDLLCLIPVLRPDPVVAALDLAAPGDHLAEVDPTTFRSARHPEVFVVGDGARHPYGYNAAAAVAAGHLCAAEIARSLAPPGGRPPAPPGETRVRTACYPYLDAEAALRLEVDFTARMQSEGLVLESETVAETTATVDNRRRRRAWEAGLLADLLDG
jgi:NADPH-dependent 2,4-dienoyl-CoA reductase/sulfur reductase-like enzyme